MNLVHLARTCSRVGRETVLESQDPMQPGAFLRALFGGPVLLLKLIYFFFIHEVTQPGETTR